MPTASSSKYSYLIQFLLLIFISISTSQQSPIYEPNSNVQIKEIDLVQTRNPLFTIHVADSYEQTIKFDTAFTEIPQVIFGITQIAILTKATNLFDFKITQSLVSTLSFNVALSKTEVQLGILKVFYLAILSPYAYTYSGSMTLTDKEMFPPGSLITAIRRFPYHFTNFNPSTQQRKISVFLTGFSQLYNAFSPPNNNQWSIRIDTDTTASTTFDLIFTIYDENNSVNTLNFVEYNYIEFIEDNIQTPPKERMYACKDTTFEDTSPSTDLIGQNINTQRTSPSNPLIFEDIDTVSRIFFGLTSVQLTQTSDAIRLTVKPNSFTYTSPSGPGTLILDYKTWATTSFDRIIFSAIAFSKVKEASIPSKGNTNSGDCCICEDPQKTYDLNSKSCIYKNEGGLSEETIKEIKDKLESLNTASACMAIVFAISSAFTNSGMSMLSQVNAMQKVYYLLLVNITLPHSLSEFLRALAGGGILRKISTFDVIQYMSVSETEHELGYSYGREGITADILQNAGGAISLGAALLILTIVFYAVLRWNFSKTSAPHNSIYLKIYSNAFSGFQIQSMVLIAFVFFSSACIALTSSDTLYEPYVICLSCILITISCVIFLFIIRVVAQTTKAMHQPFNPVEKPSKQAARNLIPPNSNPAFTTKILMLNVIEKILRNNTISDKPRTRNYIIYVTSFQCFLFPIVSISTRKYALSAVILLAILQVIELAYTAYMFPFHSKLMNWAYILESIVFTLAYALYAMLTFKMIQSSEDSTIPSFVLVCSNLTTISILIAMFINPIYQIIQICIALKEAISKRRETNSRKNSQEKLLNQIRSIELTQKFHANVNSIGIKHLQSSIFEKNNTSNHNSPSHLLEN